MSEKHHIVEKSNSNELPEGYITFIAELKSRIRSAQLKAAIAVNKELIQLYWEIGSAIFKEQKNADWGAKIIEKLVRDLKSTFPDMKGFSLTNIKYMVQFAKEYPEFTISQQVVGQIPWEHIFYCSKN